MKKKEIAALLAAAVIFLLVGCNYNRILISPPQDRSVAADATLTDAPATTGDATATDATATDAQTTAVHTTADTTTQPSVPGTTAQVPATAAAPVAPSPFLRTYDFSGLKYSVHSTAAACYDLREDRFLYEKNAGSRLSPASLTKIVTACVALKYVAPSAVYTVGNEINMAGPNSSLCFIKAGHQLTLYDLLCGMMLASGNDAAYTVAVKVSSTIAGEVLPAAEGVSRFVDLMNGFAAEIGLTDSHFVNPEGWDDPGQYMSLRDIVVAARYAMSLDVFRDIVSRPTYNATFLSGQTITWKNSNLMLDPASPFYLPGVAGVKTGTTPLAGKCLISYYRDDAYELLSASMGNPTEEERYYSVREMIDTVRYQ